MPIYGHFKQDFYALLRFSGQQYFFIYAESINLHAPKKTKSSHHKG